MSRKNHLHELKRYFLPLFFAGFLFYFISSVLPYVFQDFNQCQIRISLFQNDSIFESKSSCGNLGGNNFGVNGDTIFSETAFILLISSINGVSFFFFWLLSTLLAIYYTRTKFPWAKIKEVYLGVYKIIVIYPILNILLFLGIPLILINGVLEISLLIPILFLLVFLAITNYLKAGAKIPRPNVFEGLVLTAIPLLLLKINSTVFNVWSSLIYRVLEILLLDLNVSVVPYNIFLGSVLALFLASLSFFLLGSFTKRKTTYGAIYCIIVSFVIVGLISALVPITNIQPIILFIGFGIPIYQLIVIFIVLSIAKSLMGRV